MSGRATATPAVRKTRQSPIEHPIRNDEEYNAIVREMDELLDGDYPEGSADDDRFELLSVLVQAYEAEHEPMPNLSSPQAVVKFMAEQKGVGPGVLARLMGGRSRLSDFMTGKRELSRKQIKALRDALGIPADLLIGLLVAFVSTAHLVV
jgi:HTH-type transcriptional regulator / antitoxin HigA